MWNLKLNAFTEDEVRLKIFSQTLVDKTLSWYNSHSPGRFDSWKELSPAFCFIFIQKGNPMEQDV